MNLYDVVEEVMTIKQILPDKHSMKSILAYLNNNEEVFQRYGIKGFCSKLIFAHMSSWITDKTEVLAIIELVKEEYKKEQTGTECPI